MGRSKKGKRRASLPHGLNPKTFPVSVREYVEIDYLHQLGPKEREWLARFNDQHHGADFRKDRGRTPVAQKREAYRRKNAANQDVYAISRVNGLAVSTLFENGKELDIVERLSREEGQSTDASPEYLRTEEYQRALARVRELLPRHPRNKVRNTPELRAAYAALERAKRELP